MARIRSVKPEMRRSLTVCAWPYPVRWTFVGLPGYMDDAGRGIDDVRLVKAELYPIDDDMTTRKLEEHLARIEREGPLCRYEVGGVRYLHITSWREHQRVNRPTPSRIPPCPKHEEGVSAPHVLTEPSVSPPVLLTDDSPGERKGKEGSRERKGREHTQPLAAPPPKTPRRTRIPDVFPPDEATAARLKEWARGRAPAVDLGPETENWQDWHRAKGDTAKDWPASWRTWMVRAQKDAEKRGPVGVVRPFRGNARVDAGDAILAEAYARAEQQQRQQPELGA